MNAEHDASQHALGASAAADSEEAMGHAKVAEAKAKKGDNTGAAIAHLKAAKAHQDADRDGSDNDQDHDNAAMLHKKAAQLHTVTSNRKDDPMSRESTLNRLAAGCSAEERALLARLSTPALQRLATNAKKKGEDDDEDEDDDDEDEMENNDAMAGKAAGSNADAGPIGSRQAGGAGTIDEYPRPSQTGSAVNPLPRPTGNRRTQQWWNSAPPEVQEATRHYMRWQREQKTALVNRLVANVGDKKRRRALAENFMGKSLDELNDLVSLIPQQPRRDIANAFGGERPPWEDPAPLGIYDTAVVNQDMVENAAPGGVDPSLVANEDMGEMNLTMTSNRSTFSRDRLKKGAVTNSANAMLDETA